LDRNKRDAQIKAARVLSKFFKAAFKLGSLVGFVLIVFYSLYDGKPVKALDQKLVCEGATCHILVKLVNESTDLQAGNLRVTLYRNQGASAVAGGKSGYISKRYYVDEVPFELKAEEVVMIKRLYTHRFKSPMVFANVVLDEG